MTNEIYHLLNKAKLIKLSQCTKEEYEFADPARHYSDRPDLDGYYLYDEVKDTNELILKVLAQQLTELRTVKLVLIIMILIVAFLMYSQII